MTVQNLAGRGCHDAVVCMHLRDDSDWPHKDPASLCLEATLLVLEGPADALDEVRRLNYSSHVLALSSAHELLTLPCLCTSLCGLRSLLR